MCRQQANSDGACCDAGANARRRIFYDDAFVGTNAASMRALEVGIRAGRSQRYIVLRSAKETHLGLPRSTSSERMKTSGSAMPAAAMAGDAYLRVADVHTAQRGLGRCLAGAS